MAFKALSSIKIKVDLKPSVDSLVFKLHYRYTHLVYLGAMLLSTLYDVVGKKIDCISGNPSESFNAVVGSYCFIMGTFTVDRLHASKVGVEVPHPGVGPPDPEDDITYHTYYQWVPFVLFMQAVVFYVPHWLWKKMEGGLFRTVIQDLSVKDYLGQDLKNYFGREERFRVMSTFARQHMRQHKHWAHKFLMCEALNLAVVVGMMYFTDWFLGGEFLEYGTNVIQVAGVDPENRTDPMSAVFPRMAKCTFRSFGSSGTIQVRDVMCLIATNIINEKIFLFLWVWLVLLTVLTALWVFVRLLLVVFSPLRIFVLKQYVTKEQQLFVGEVLRGASLSEWLLFMNLAKNMEVTVFSEFVRFFATEKTRSSDTIPMDDFDNSSRSS